MLIEVALVSEQTLANLIPALHERPDRVLLVTSAEMARRGLDTRQSQLLRQHGIDAEIAGSAMPLAGRTSGAALLPGV